jgi:hypothetical protein
VDLPQGVSPPERPVSPQRQVRYKRRQHRAVPHDVDADRATSVRPLLSGVMPQLRDVHPVPPVDDEKDQLRLTHRRASGTQRRERRHSHRGGLSGPPPPYPGRWLRQGRDYAPLPPRTLTVIVEVKPDPAPTAEKTFLPPGVPAGTWAIRVTWPSLPAMVLPIGVLPSVNATFSRCGRRGRSASPHSRPSRSREGRSGGCRGARGPPASTGVVVRRGEPLVVRPPWPVIARSASVSWLEPQLPSGNPPSAVTTGKCGSPCRGGIWLRHRSGYGSMPFQRSDPSGAARNLTPIIPHL